MLQNRTGDKFSQFIGVLVAQLLFIVSISATDLSLVAKLEWILGIVVLGWGWIVPTLFHSLYKTHHEAEQDSGDITEAFLTYKWMGERLHDLASEIHDLSKQEITLRGRHYVKGQLSALQNEIKLKEEIFRKAKGIARKCGYPMGAHVDEFFPPEESSASLSSIASR